MHNTEIEIAFPLLNADAVRAWLDAQAQLQHAGQHQKDTYYVPAHRDFLAERPISDWLRVRESDKGANLNFKHWHNQDDAQAISCDEYEVGVSDAQGTHEILKHIGCRPVVVVEKTRRTYLYRSVEIALDQVQGLGSFIELEDKGEYKNIAEAKQHLFDVLGELGAEVGKQDYRGYPHLLLEKSGYNLG